MFRDRLTRHSIHDALIHKVYFDILRGGAAAETAESVVQKLWDQLGEMPPCE